jgi:hypothetical protein
MFGYLVTVAAALGGFVQASPWVIAVTAVLLFLSAFIEDKPDRFKLWAKLTLNQAMYLHGYRILTSTVAATAAFLLGRGVGWFFPL